MLRPTDHVVAGVSAPVHDSDPGKREAKWYSFTATLARGRLGRTRRPLRHSARCHQWICRAMVAAEHPKHL